MADKMRASLQRRRWRMAAALGASALAVLLLAGWRSRIPFNHRLWQHSWQFSSGGWVHPLDVRRLRMVNDLTANHIHAGMTRRQVHALLGAPSSATGPASRS